MNKTTHEPIIKKVPSPSQFLEQALGRPVTVKLTNDSEYRGKVFYSYLGILLCLDPSMNLALDQVEELHNGEIVDRHSSMFIRGNNGKQNKSNF